MSESFADLFNESLQRSEMRTGEVITAEVVRIDHNHVVVNAGLKSEAYVPLEEFKNDQGELEVQVGDFVSVAIDSVENGYGDTLLSRDKAKRLASWMSLEKALESGEFVTGTTSEPLYCSFLTTTISTSGVHDSSLKGPEETCVSGLVL